MRKLVGEVIYYGFSGSHDRRLDFSELRMFVWLLPGTIRDLNKVILFILNGAIDKFGTSQEAFCKLGNERACWTQEEGAFCYLLRILEY
jgi:hypothetical protein